MYFLGTSNQKIHLIIKGYSKMSVFSDFFSYLYILFRNIFFSQDQLLCLYSACKFNLKVFNRSLIYTNLLKYPTVGILPAFKVILFNYCEEYRVPGGERRHYGLLTLTGARWLLQAPAPETPTRRTTTRLDWRHQDRGLLSSLREVCERYFPI